MSALSLNITDELVSFLSHIKNRREFNDLRTAGSEYSLAGFDRLKCIYVHIPKSAGVSVNKSLFGNMGGGHKTAVQYRKIFGPYTFHKYFKFTFVRNPYSRLLSAYLFLKKGGMNRNNQKWAEENLSPYSTFQEFVEGWINPENVLTYYHFLPQYHFLCDDRQNLLIDYIGKVENIRKDFENICQKLGIEKKLLSLNQTSGAIDWKSYYDDQTLEIVARVYKCDFDLFNYSTELS